MQQQNFVIFFIQQKLSIIFQIKTGSDVTSKLYIERREYVYM